MSGCGTHGGAMWYRHYPADFLDGVKSMSAEERGCYITVLDLIYQFGGKIADRAQWIAGQCNVSVKRWKAIYGRLSEIGKLLVTDGWLTNPRATKECAAMAATSEARRTAARENGKRSGKARRRQAGNAEMPASDAPAAPTNDLPEEFEGFAWNQPVSGTGSSAVSPDEHCQDVNDLLPDNRPKESPAFQSNQSLNRTRDSDSKKESTNSADSESVTARAELNDFAQRSAPPPPPAMPPPGCVKVNGEWVPIEPPKLVVSNPGINRMNRMGSPDPKTGKAAINGFDIVAVMRKACEIARITNPQAETSCRDAIERWLSEGVEANGIYDALRRAAAREDYKPPFSLKWFDKRIKRPSEARAG